jgi:tRNA(fMet)-specific endonuclease VapC
VWHELNFGCRRLPKSRKRDVIEYYLKELLNKLSAILPYDEKAAGWHAEQRARLTALGKPAPFVDGQIAAVAKVNGLILVTRNESNYRRFSDVIIENWHEF